MSGPGYIAAQAQWFGASLVGGGAAQDIPYALAKVALQSGETTDTGNRSGYAAAIATLAQLSNFPDANVSPAQDAEFRQWSAQLNAFFGNPSSIGYGSCETTSPQSKEAAIEWSQQPAGTSSGVSIQLLDDAISDLKAAPTNLLCYGAALADLEGLQTATPAEVAAITTSGPDSPATLVLERIKYLNEFFLRDGSLPSSWDGVLTHH